EQPQKQLLLSIQDGSSPTGTVWLRSPQSGMATDAYNGPIPKHVRVVKEVGGVTMLVEVVLETFVNECPGRTLTVPVPPPGVGTVSVRVPPIVLSHRWEATDDISLNSGYLTTRTVRGHAVLRTDAALQANVVPDDFRREFFHPVIPNCQREDIVVRAT